MREARRLRGLPLALILLAGCASLRPAGGAQESETVEAEGWAPIDPNDAAGTRQRAIAEAQKKAVEKVAGVFLAASTKVDAAVTVRQRITADVKGYIRRYEVLEERTEAGFLKTRIRAFVARQKAGAAGPEAQAAEPPPGSPKVFVTIRGSGPQAGAWSASAASAVRGKLLARGFQVAEDGPASHEAVSNLVVRGEARAYEVKDPHIGSFRSYRAKVTLEALAPGTEDVIWRQSQEASALGVDPESASSRAVENAGELLGPAAADSLSAYLWKRF